MSQSSSKSTSARPPRVALCNVQFAALTEAQAIDHILGALDAGHGGWMITSNLDHLYRSRKDPAFRAMLEQADLVVADGMPLIWASRLQGQPLPQRVAGSSLVHSLSAAAAARGRSLYLLGGAPGAADGAAQVLARKYPQLTIAGTHCPPLGFEQDPAQMQQLASLLSQANPDLVYVALGSPKQEQLIGQLRPTLPGAWWIGVGISLSFVSGQIKRAPRWMQHVGLEWAHRLAQEPLRLTQRYLLRNLPFAVSLLTSAAIKGCCGGPTHKAQSNGR